MSHSYLTVSLNPDQGCVAQDLLASCGPSEYSMNLLFASASHSNRDNTEFPLDVCSIPGPALTTKPVSVYGWHFVLKMPY